jgi:hypothetical protein
MKQKTALKYKTVENNKRENVQMDIKKYHCSNFFL